MSWVFRSLLPLRRSSKHPTRWATTWKKEKWEACWNKMDDKSVIPVTCSLSGKTTHWLRSSKLKHFSYETLMIHTICGESGRSGNDPEINHRRAHGDPLRLEYHLTRRDKKHALKMILRHTHQFSGIKQRFWYGKCFGLAATLHHWGAQKK